MAKKIRWSPKAADSFEEICNFIAKDSEYSHHCLQRKLMQLLRIRIQR